MVINYSCTEREKQLYPGCTESRHSTAIPVAQRQFFFPGKVLAMSRAMSHGEQGGFLRGSRPSSM